MPDAEIVFDRYHVQNLLNVELKSVLIVIRSSLTLTQHHEMMRRENLVLKSRHRLSDIPRREGLKILQPEKGEVEVWFATSPLLARAYDLKESFSDILQLSDRKKAEELTDQWLERLAEFVRDFEIHYEKECDKLRKYPFKSALSSFRRYRAYILNYIDFKSRFILKVTNAFAEFANRQIKKAHAIGNGYRYEVLRAKLIHGGLLKRKMPEHPLDAPVSVKTPKKAKRKSSGKIAKNPDANIPRLRKVMKDQDKIGGAVQRPQENKGWLDRFGSSQPLDSSPRMINYGVRDEDDKKPDLAIYKFDENKFSEHPAQVRSKPVKHQRRKSVELGQPPLFQFFENPEVSE